MKKLFLFFMAAALMAAFSAPAAANDAQWSFYGIMKYDTWSIEDSKERDLVHTPGKSDRDTTWSVDPGARIGAKVKKGDVGGGFEYGHTTTVNLRILYGTWNFGAGQRIGTRGSVQAKLAVELVAAVMCHRVPGINRLREQQHGN